MIFIKNIGADRLELLSIKHHILLEYKKDIKNKFRNHFRTLFFEYMYKEIIFIDLYLSSNKIETYCNNDIYCREHYSFKPITSTIVCNQIKNNSCKK